MNVRERASNNSNKIEKSGNKIWWAIAAIPLFLVFLILWGLIEPYFLEEEEEEAVIPNLPAAWEGKKIAQVSDFQVGMWWDNVSTIAKSVDKIIEEQPAAVLISGDFIYHADPNPEPTIAEVVDLLRPLTEANIPTYAVLGNHDYGMTSKKVKPDLELALQLENALEAIAIPVLKNEAVELPSANAESDLYLVGVGSTWADNDNVDLALAQIPLDSPQNCLNAQSRFFCSIPGQYRTVCRSRTYSRGSNPFTLYAQMVLVSFSQRRRGFC